MQPLKKKTIHCCGTIFKILRKKSKFWNNTNDYLKTKVKKSQICIQVWYYALKGNVQKLSEKTHAKLLFLVDIKICMIAGGGGM